MSRLRRCGGRELRLPRAVDGLGDAYMQVSRRFLLTAALAGCVPSRGWAVMPDARARVVARLRSSVGFPSGAAGIGAAYRATHPLERDPGSLLAQVLADLRLDSEGLMALDDAALERALRSCVLRDFAAGRVVVLDCWMLSRSEARICALT